MRSILSFLLAAAALAVGLFSLAAVHSATGELDAPASPASASPASASTALASTAPASPSEPASAVTRVEGATLRVEGQWVERDFFIVDDTIRWRTDREPGDTLRLPGRYVTPGFADAHTHNLDRVWQQRFVDSYLSEGTLVVQNLTSKSDGVREFRAFMEGRPSPKVRYANWGFTSTLGHPFMAYEPYTMGLDRSTWDEKADTIAQSRIDLYNSYAFVDSVGQLASIWPRFLETEPDLVKIYYFNEDQIEANIENQVMGQHGLRRAVAAAIIDSAHAAGLEVYAHVETRSDFEAMLDDGVDGIAHMPGYSWGGDSTTVDTYDLPDAVLENAARQGVVIVPTAALNAYTNRNDSTALQAAAAFQTDLIRRYRQMGGAIAPGSDIFGSTGEAVYTYYAKHIGLSPGEKLDLLTTEATEAILPDMQTGRIADGYEASFLVFRERPFASGSWTRPAQVYLRGVKVAANASSASGGDGEPR